MDFSWILGGLVLDYCRIVPGMILDCSSNGLGLDVLLSHQCTLLVVLSVRQGSPTVAMLACFSTRPETEPRTFRMGNRHPIYFSIPFSLGPDVQLERTKREKGVRGLNLLEISQVLWHQCSGYLSNAAL